MVASPDASKRESPAPKEDHRVRVARQRRERMRAKLFQSIMAVCSGRPANSPAVIDDVIQHARVSRGTFYKYFESLEEAISELALNLADEMTVASFSVYDVLTDPVARTSTGFQMFLVRALQDHNWAGFFIHIGLLSGDNHVITAKIKRDLLVGIETGDYVVPSVDIATDILMGAKIEAMRRILGGEGDEAYVRQMASMVLCSFGVSRARAEKYVDAAFNRLILEAPGKLEWWNPAPGTMQLTT